MALSDKKIDAVTLLQWGEMKGHPLAAHRAYARAIEAEVRGQDDALIRQLVEALDNHAGNYKLTLAECTPIEAVITAARLRLEGTQ